MDVAIMGIMIPIISIIGSFITVVYIRKFVHMERMSIIEKGLDPKIFKSDKVEPGPLRWSLLLIGSGIGLLLGHWLDRAFYMEETGYFSMLLIFGGLGLGVAYLIEDKRSRNKLN